MSNTSIIKWPGKLAAGTVVTALALLLVGCGGSADSGPAVVAFTPPPAIAPPAAACSKASSKVGQVATLSTRSHGVAGKATVIDDCTIEIRNFSYDGGGLARVFVYGAIAGNYRAGFAIGNNLRGTSFANQTLSIALNPGDLDKLDGISIWCTDATISFGDGLFAPA